MDQALWEAVSQGSLEQCERLLASGAHVNHPDSHGWSPLCLALSYGHSHLARFLLESGADVNVQNPYGIGVLTLAVTLDDDSLLALIYNRLTLESRKQHNDSALMVACLKGRYSSVHWLLTNTSARVNGISTMTGVSALHLAVIGGQTRVVKLLLLFGADPSIRNGLGQTSIDLAEKQDVPNPELLNLLGCVRTPTHSKKKHKRHSVEPQFTANNILLDVGGDVVLRNSPNRPVFDKNLGVEPEMKALLSPSMRSVFLESPLGRSTPNYLHKASLGDYFKFFNGKNQGCVKKQPKKSNHSSDFISQTRVVQEKNLEETVYSPILESPQKETKSSFLSNFLLTPLKNSIQKSRKRGREQSETPRQEKRFTPKDTSACKVRKLSESFIGSLSFEDQTEDTHADFNKAFIYSPSPNKLFMSSPTNIGRGNKKLINFTFGLQSPDNQRDRSQKLTYNQTRESRYLSSLLSPKYDQKTNSFKRRKKRHFVAKIKWLKTLAKRKPSRSKSLDDSGDYVNLDELKDDGIDFQQLLFNHGLDEFRTIFLEHELDFSTFITVKRSDLISIGIEEQESQDRILEVVKIFGQFKL